MILLHGGFGSVEDFASQTPELSKHFNVVAFERPGHGHTTHTYEPFSFPIMSGYTVKFIEALGLGPSNLVGWSDGGIVGLFVAISRPDLVKRFVCVSGSFNASSVTPKSLDWIRSSTSESFRKDEAILARQYEDVSPDGPAHFPVVFEKTKRMWLNEPDIRKEVLARIVALTLVMAADGDVVPFEHTMKLFKSIKNAQLCVVPGTTHFLLCERPDATNRMILDFLIADRRQLSSL